MKTVYLAVVASDDFTDIIPVTANYEWDYPDELDKAVEETQVSLELDGYRILDIFESEEAAMEMCCEYWINCC